MRASEIKNMTARHKVVTSVVILLAFITMTAGVIFAADGDITSGETHALDPSTLIGVAVMLVIAKLGGEVFERLGQPGVLGELVGGIVIGNLYLVGLHGAESLKTNET